MATLNDHVLVNRDGVVLHALVELCRRKVWPLVDVLDRDPMKRGFQFATGTDGIEVVAVVDRQAGMEYAIVVGHPAADGESSDVRTSVAHAINALDEAALAAAYDGARDRHERSAALLRLAIAAPPWWSERTATRLKDGLESRDKAIRGAAVFGVHYRLWNRWRPVLEEALQRETDATIASNLETLLRDWNKKTLSDPEVSVMTYLVPRSSVFDDEYPSREPRRSFLRACAEKRYPVVSIVIEDPERGVVASLGFDAGGGREQIAWIDNEFLVMSYVQMADDLASDTGQLAEATDALRLPEVGEALDRPGLPEAVRERLVFALALVARDDEAEALLRCMTTVIERGSDVLRHAVVTAISYRPRAVFQPLVEALAADSDEELRGRASFLLTRLS